MNVFGHNLTLFREIYSEPYFQVKSSFLHAQQKEP